MNDDGSEMSTNFKIHHVAISVRSLDRTADFYGILGFRLCLLWNSSDDSLRLAHLALADGYILEVFEYSTNRTARPSDLSVGNATEVVGVKHLALRVDNLNVTRDELVGRGMEPTPIGRGRTDVMFCYVRDPDGLWVELIQDDRALSPDHPIYLPSGTAPQ
jgi:glyoxylase I family protein